MTDKYEYIKSFIKEKDWEFSEKQERNFRQICIHGKRACFVTVYRTGYVEIKGRNSEIRKALSEIQNTLNENKTQLKKIGDICMGIALVTFVVLVGFDSSAETASGFGGMKKYIWAVLLIIMGVGCGGYWFTEYSLKYKRMDN